MQYFSGKNFISPIYNYYGNKKWFDEQKNLK